MHLIRALLLALALSLFPVAAQAAPAKDWSRTVTLTREGAHVIGNPAAKTRLVEYVSYTCPHCAHFVAEGTAPLKAGWVSKGLVAVEVRNLVRDRYDLLAALLARCGGPVAFPGHHEALFAAQQDWMAKAMALESDPPAYAPDMSQGAMMTDIARRIGLIGLMEKRGVPPARSRVCLADGKAMQTVLAMTSRATQDDQVTGTPSFLLNGKLTEVHDWAGLRPLLPTLAK
ncbi:thioredoxin domain-containing protein [Sphingobium sp. DEHP117]|uniref:thioredoxin domain-containing protein n=1 Tax=Sphingobium sp. DEHP117 TaxID=2993436 RepID=UPI0027D6C8F8|nr:thioredoxin domain-containing protein [Sphingobium sp. DEHP117]MDQ4420855.1 thioredoxin domain-containing protein [Sphingobium sp. DEHP117]